jgi:hypothetical protein
MGVENDEVGDGFWRDVQLAQLFQKRIGDSADTPLHDGIGFPLYQIEVEEFTSQKGDVLSDLEWEQHEIELTHPNS